VGSFPKITKK